MWKLLGDPGYKLTYEPTPPPKMHHRKNLNLSDLCKATDKHNMHEYFSSGHQMQHSSKLLIDDLMHTV